MSDDALTRTLQPLIDAGLVRMATVADFPPGTFERKAQELSDAIDRDCALWLTTTR